MDADVQSVRQRLQWVQRKAHRRRLEPISGAFACVLARVWQQTRDLSTCEMLRAWWHARFNAGTTTLPLLTADLVRHTVAKYTPAYAATRLPQSTLQRVVFYTQQFLAEKAVVLWLLEQNAKGLTIASVTLAARFLEQWPRPFISSPHYAYLCLFEHTGYCKKWAWCFRRRWNAGWRALPTSTPLHADDVRRKANAEPKAWPHLALRH